MEERIWEPYPIKEQIHISDMYTFFQVHHPGGYAFPGETHNFWECVYIMKGKICVSADERIYNLESGEIIFHKPLELHKFTVESPESADLLIFSFSAEGPLTTWLKDKVFTLSEAQIAHMNSLLSYISSQLGCNVQSTVASNTTAPEQKIQQHHSLFYNYLDPCYPIANYSQMVVCYLYQLFLSLNSEGSVSGVSTAPDALTFRKAINYLNNNLSRRPTVAETARFCSVSVSGLKRIFDKYAGIGVHQYLMKLKIKAAIDLLESGETVTSVAERTGFNNQSYFSEAFKRETGLTPSAFKRTR